MVCKLVNRVCCIVRDYTGTSQQSKFESTFPSDTPVRELINEVANYFCYDPDSIVLTLQRPSGNDVSYIFVFVIRSEFFYF